MFRLRYILKNEKESTVFTCEDNETLNKKISSLHQEHGFNYRIISIFTN